jgi:hypothetical protein
MRFRPEDLHRKIESRFDAYSRLEGVTITRRTALRWGSLASLLAAAGCSDASGGDQGTSGSDASDDAGTLGTSGESGDDGGLDTTGDESDSTDSAGDEGTEDTGLEPITLEELMAIVHPWAVDLVAAGNPDDLGYNAECEELLARLEHELPYLMAPNYELDPLLIMAPVEIFQIEMSPGSSIPLHDHQDYIGSIVAMAGNCDAVNYTKLTEPDPEGWFELQEVSSGTLMPGMTGSLGLVDANFHVLNAGPNGCQLVDVFTFFDPQGYSNWADLDPTPLNAENKIYRARYA